MSDLEDFKSSIPLKKVLYGDVFEASRVGDVDRLRYLLESGVNVNARDQWDSVTLYYACLAGHLDAARMLLESGAICYEHTFDGDRCHDQWDSVALYNVCLTEHLDAARILLESGAIYYEHTFDGDRCHYAALNLKVRKLLKAFEARPSPLVPLQAALRDTFLSC